MSTVDQVQMKSGLAIKLKRSR